MGKITLGFYQLIIASWLSKLSHGICFVLLVLTGLFFSQNVFAQAQTIGEFPLINGGFETGSTTGTASGVVLGSSTSWVFYTGSTSSATIVTTAPRSGVQCLQWITGTTSAILSSPTVGTGMVVNTSYVIQFYYLKGSGATARKFAFQASSDGTANIGTTGTSPTNMANTTWTKGTSLVSTTKATPAAANGLIQLKPSGGGFNPDGYFLDDIVVYQGTVEDVSAPNPATVPVATVSGSDVNVSWTASTTPGVDGGGYVVIRYTTSPNANNDPNQNGIYGVGNTTNNGTGALLGTVVYSGTGTSFTDVVPDYTVPYYYKIYAVDKAFNYAAEVQIASVPPAIAPVLTADTTNNNVDNFIDISFPDNPAWRAAITAIKIGTTTLIAGTDYVVTSGNLQLKPSGLNVLLTTSGSKSVIVKAIGYTDATVIQTIDAGALTVANSSVTISAALAPNTPRTITATARDQYNNLIPGYVFKYDVTITNANSTTIESYVNDGVPQTVTINDIPFAATNGGGITSFVATLPALIDTFDGISIQVKLNDGVTNLGSAFSYIQRLPQIITFGPLSPVTYGDATFSLNATSDSGLIVTYTSSNTAVATVSGNILNIVSAGSVSITASQTGNGTYAPASDVTQVLMVNPKALTIIGLSGVNKVYNGTPAATLSGTPTYVGLVSPDSFVVTGTPVATFTTFNAGTAIPITVTGYTAPSGNYTVVQPTGLTADITKANQTITFPFLGTTTTGHQNSVDIDPQATSATSGTNPITYASSVGSVATIVANKIHYVNVGTTIITASQAASANYNAASVTQTLNVLPAPLLAWDFTGCNCIITSQGATVFPGLVSTTLVRGTGVPGAPAVAGTNTFRTGSFSNDGIAITNTDYYEFTVQAGSGRNVSLSTINADFSGSVGSAFVASPGVASQFAYNTGSGFVLIGSPVYVIGVPNTMPQIDLSGIAALQNVPSGTTITFRYYASGQASSGNFGFYSLGIGKYGLSIGGSTQIISTTWTGTAAAGSWSNGVPNVNVEAIIAGVFDTSISSGGGFTAQKLTVNSGGSLTIKTTGVTGTTVTVKNEVINNAGANGIVVENNSSLLQTNDAAPANTGVIKYIRNTTPVLSTDYTYWSSPVANQQLNISPSYTSGVYYSYNDFAIPEDWKEELASTVMVVGKGYIVRGPLDSNPASVFVATLTGVPNNGPKSIAIGPTGVSVLIGNPYPSALNADLFLTANAGVLSGTLYFWTHTTAIQLASNILDGSAGTGVYAYTSNDYATYNITGGVGIDLGSSTSPGTGSVTPSGYIAAGQGFFGTSKATGGSVVFNNSMRVAGNNLQFFKTKSTKEKTAKVIEKNRVWLNLTNTQGLFKQILVGYVTGATNEYDDRFDGESFDANPFADFYSINQNKKLVIQGRALPFDKNDEVPLGFETTINGPLTISIDNADGLLANQKVFLEDKLTNTITDLRKESYTFNTVPGTFDKRFVLRYANNKSHNNNNKPQGVNEASLSENSIKIYKSYGVIYVDAANLIINTVRVYNTQGKLITEQKNVNAATAAIKDVKETKQVLVVKITSQEGKVVTKKVIN